MYQLDVSTLSGFLASFWYLATGALHFDPNAYIAAATQDGGAVLTITILFWAGLSITLGQSVVLFANRVSKRRFAISLVTFAAIFVLSIFVWAAIIWSAAELIFDAQRPYRSVLIVVALSYAPFLFGFLVLLPYLGNIILAILRVWVYLSILLSVAELYQFSLLNAFVCTFLGWLLIEFFTHFPPLRIEALKDWVWRVTTGTDQEMQSQEIVDRYVHLSKQAIDAIRKRSRSEEKKQ